VGKTSSNLDEVDHGQLGWRLSAFAVVPFVQKFDYASTDVVCPASSPAFNPADPNNIQP